ncbi:MAG TPA: thioesterase family protein [Phycisphaerales bacterium]|nr:thioesterase family protein [Phycisphaerales bacterium]
MRNAPDTRPNDNALTPTRILRDAAHRLRVRYCECDPMGVAHHSSYVAWLEIGRTELLRDCGVSYADLEKAGTFLVVVRLDVRYRRPVRYDDLVEVRTYWKGGSKVKVEHEYEVVVVERGGQACEELAGAASTTLACVDGEGRVRVLPEWLVTG